MIADVRQAGTRIAPRGCPRNFERSFTEKATQACLIATVAVTAMIPWYSLRLWPLVAFGHAKINLLDGLVAAAFLLALPRVLRGLIAQREPLWYICAFLAAMVVSLSFGLRDPHAAFLAIREARALAYYALALVFATGGYDRNDFRKFAAAYVGGATITAAATFAQAERLLTLPGYPNFLSGSYHLGVPGFLIAYLDWTVPTVAFVLSLSVLFMASLPRVFLAAGVSLLTISWYVLAAGERFLQFVVACCALGVPVIMGAPRHWPRAIRVAAAGMAATVILAAAAGAATSTAWIAGPIRTTILRWSRATTDDSLRFRVLEILGGLPQFTRHPVFGIGLGKVVTMDPEHPGHPWPYVSSSYGFLIIKTGLVGLLTYLAMAYFALREAWRQRRRQPMDTAWPTATVGLLGLAALLLLNLLHISVDTPEGAVAFSLFFGLIMSGRAENG
jgi:hypothetical protein